MATYDFVPVYRYDFNWWRDQGQRSDAHRVSYYTTSVQECRWLESKFLAAESKIKDAKYCPVNWEKDIYNQTYTPSLAEQARRAVFKVFIQPSSHPSNDVAIYRFGCRYQGEYIYESSIYVNSPTKMQYFLQKHLNPTNLTDGEWSAATRQMVSKMKEYPKANSWYSYSGTNFSALPNKDGQPTDIANIIVPVYEKRIVSGKGHVTWVYSTDTTSTEMVPSRDSIAFYAYPWNFQGSTDGFSPQTNYSLPWQA